MSCRQVAMFYDWKPSNMTGWPKSHVNAPTVKKLVDNSSRNCDLFSLPFEGKQLVFWRGSSRCGTSSHKLSQQRKLPSQKSGPSGDPPKIGRAHPSAIGFSARALGLGAARAAATAASGAPVPGFAALAEGVGKVWGGGAEKRRGGVKGGQKNRLIEKLEKGDQEKRTALSNNRGTMTMNRGVQEDLIPAALDLPGRSDRRLIGICWGNTREGGNEEDTIHWA